MFPEKRTREIYLWNHFSSFCQTIVSGLLVRSCHVRIHVISHDMRPRKTGESCLNVRPACPVFMSGLHVRPSRQVFVSIICERPSHHIFMSFHSISMSDPHIRSSCPVSMSGLHVRPLHRVFISVPHVGLAGFTSGLHFRCSVTTSRRIF